MGTKGFIFQCGRRDIIGGGRFGVLIYIAGAGEQIFPVSQRCHIDRIQGKRFFVHDVDRHMGKIEVFQPHLADIVHGIVHTQSRTTPTEGLCFF